MKIRTTSLIHLCLGVFLLGCSTQKNRLVNREYHALNTKFNVLFNGKEALDIGQAVLYQNQQDDFLSILAIEPIALDNEDQEATASIPSFAVAEEKAVKAIQKHSMDIAGAQRNRQIQQAYLLLGKARYFDRRFVPALEAFNFILKDLANGELYVEGKLWREKTNLRLGNYALAVDNLKPLSLQIPFHESMYAKINATIAQAYIYLQELDSARTYITRASMAEKDKTLKSRFRYVEAQLLEQANELDSAQGAYQSIVNWKRKAPRIFWMQAKLQSVRLQSLRDSISPTKALDRLASPFENRPYVHLIRQQQARYYMRQSEDSLALDYYNQSLRSPYVDAATRRDNYRELADYFFVQGEYLKTGAYLDSILQEMPKESRSTKVTERERKGLEEVIRLEKAIQSTDSILRLVALSPNEQRAFFKAEIDRKRQLELAAVEQEKKSIFSFGKSGENTFYFYNERLLVAGKQAFLSSWGNRPNTDNWNRSSNASWALQQTTTKSSSNEQPSGFFIETPAFYMAQLPTQPQIIDSLKSIRKQAYLDVGILYKEKFSNPSLALNRLEKALALFPTPSQEEQALYHCYKLLEKEPFEQADRYASQLRKKFPKSPFTQMINDPQNVRLTENQTPETVYLQLVNDFNNQRYEHLLERAQRLDVLFSGTELAPKIFLLKTYAQGRLYGESALQQGLKAFLTRFPNADEALVVRDRLALLSKQNQAPISKPQYKSYKWVFAFPKNTALDSLATQIKADLKTQGITRWKVSNDVYDKDTTFMVLHTRNQYPDQPFFRKRWQDYSNFEKQTNNFVVLSSQYEEIQRFKTLSNYKNGKAK